MPGVISQNSGLADKAIFPVPVLKRLVVDDARLELPYDCDLEWVCMGGAGHERTEI